MCQSFAPVVIGGDFNGKSPLWSSERLADREGLRIADAVASSMLCCMNEGLGLL